MKYYAGIGSRKTPDDIRILMENIAGDLEDLGFCLRSGGAKGADTFFENGVCFNKNKQIFLPWQEFNGSESPLFIPSGDSYLSTDSYKVAKKFYHSNLDKQPDATKRYMTRNVWQVLGPDLQTPVEFVVCWTSDGKVSGGTGQALRIAEEFGIRIYNLFNSMDYFLLNTYIEDLEENDVTRT